MRSSGELIATAARGEASGHGLFDGYHFRIYHAAAAGFAVISCAAVGGNPDEGCARILLIAAGTVAIDVIVGRGALCQAAARTGFGSGAVGILPIMSQGLSLGGIAGSTGLRQLTGGVLPEMFRWFALCQLADHAGFWGGTAGIDPGVITQLSVGKVANFAGLRGDTGSNLPMMLPERTLRGTADAAGLRGKTVGILPAMSCGFALRFAAKRTGLGCETICRNPAVLAGCFCRSGRSVLFCGEISYRCLAALCGIHRFVKAYSAGKETDGESKNT